MEIRVLTFAGCPGCEATFRLVREAVDELGVRATVSHIQIRSEIEAIEKRFLGSPSVQIDGKDIEVQRREDPPSFACRLYVHGGRRTGVPPKGMILKAIQEARRPAG